MSCQQLPCWHATVTNKVGISAVDGLLLSTSTCTPVPRGQQDLDAIKFTNDHQKKNDKHILQFLLCQKVATFRNGAVLLFVGSFVCLSSELRNCRALV